MATENDSSRPRANLAVPDTSIPLTTECATLAAHVEGCRSMVIEDAAANNGSIDLALGDIGARLLRLAEQVEELEGSARHG